MIVETIAGSSNSGAAIPTIVSRTNSTAANGVLYAAAKPAAVPAATRIRVCVSETARARPSAAPMAPPTSIKGPSRPIEIPPARAAHEESTRGPVARSESWTLPRATASMTLLTPCAGALRTRAIVPADAAATHGTTRRSHGGKPAIAATTLSAS